MVYTLGHKEHILWTPEDTKMDQFLKIGEVMLRVGLSRSGVYAAMRDNDFPKQFKVRGRSARWSSDEIEVWMEARKENR